ncbi:MAG TPA: hypothetical protein VGI73_00680 [Solirubrobacterales bacterium]|jgi:hypothetical protein
MSERLPFQANSARIGNLVGAGLREAPVPVDAGAEDRGLDVVLAAYAEWRPERRRNPLPRLALVLAGATLLAALLLSPAGASVRDWVGDVFSAAPAPSRSGLAAIPGGGRLLVQTSTGPWVVGADGSRHRLGDYEEASWSPHGLYVAAAAGRRLSAVEPDGSVHWSLAAPGTVRDPRWSPSGYLVAYRAGSGLRVVAGDGSEDRPLDESVAPLAPSWSPDGRPDLAYVDARGALRVIDAANGRGLDRATALAGIQWLEWGGAGSRGILLEASPRRVRLRPVSGSHPRGGPAGDRHHAGAIALGEPRAFHLPAGETVEDLALSPSGNKVAALLGRRDGAGARRTDLMIFDRRHRASVRLLSVPGRLAEVAWAPNGGRLLVGWPRLDEWLFLPTRPVAGTALAGVAKEFASGSGAAFPRVVGWCCRSAPDDAG